MCQANLETAPWVIRAVVAMPPSTRRGGLLAWTIAPSQVREAFFGMMVLFTRPEAGVTSGAARVSSLRCPRVLWTPYCPEKLEDDSVEGDGKTMIDATGLVGEGERG